MKNKILFLSLLAIAMFTGCADVINVKECIPVDSYVYGFWYGVWHGAISQISFVGSLIYDDISVYAVNNNGGWYDFGFVGGLGIMIKLVTTIIKGLNSK